MPKIIENARELILLEAKRRIDEGGYESLTIRELARGCGLGLGTVYNYFSSKETIIATLLLGRWTEIVGGIEERSRCEREPMAVVRMLFDGVREFMDENSTLFASEEAKRLFNSSVGKRHATLRAQLSDPLRGVLAADGYESPELLADFAAEAVLHWAVEGTDYDTLAPVISKLFAK